MVLIHSGRGWTWVDHGLSRSYSGPGFIASTPTLPLCPGVFLPCHWVPAVWHPAKLPSDNASRGPERLLSATAPPPGMSARTADQPGECESRGAQVPRRAFAFASELSNELSVRGDQNNAMHCRKKPRDALSVRTSPCSDVTTHSPLSRRGGRGGRKPATGSQSRMP